MTALAEVVGRVFVQLTEIIDPPVPHIYLGSHGEARIGSEVLLFTRDQPAERLATTVDDLRGLLTHAADGAPADDKTVADDLAMVMRFAHDQAARPLASKRMPGWFALFTAGRLTSEAARRLITASLDRLLEGHGQSAVPTWPADAQLAWSLLTWDRAMAGREATSLEKQRCARRDDVCSQRDWTAAAAICIADPIGPARSMLRAAVAATLFANAASSGPGAPDVLLYSIAEHPTLRIGARGTHVAHLHRRLAELGYPCPQEAVFDDLTTASVIGFKADRRLDPADGAVGPATWLALG